MKKNHYDVIANEFDEVWTFSEDYENWMIETISHYLDIKIDDIFVDIGAGTGKFTEKLIKYNSINSATCVEPSIEMCKILSKNKHFNVFCETAEEFFEGKLYRCDKLLFKEVVHHVKNRKILFENIFSNLNQNGRLLIITRPKVVEFPFFERASEAFIHSQPDYHIFEQELEASGYIVQTKMEYFNVSITREQWYQMLRKRFMSNLSTFSTETIEEGIRELELKGSNPKFQFLDKMIFITAMKL